jgi:streptogramin lyase
MVAGPDGNLWFAEAVDPGDIGEINPTTHSASRSALRRS